MSKTDKTRPARIKAAQGDATRGGYIRRATKDWGRHKDWQYWANIRERSARRAAKRALKRGDEPDPVRAAGADWDTY